MADRKISDLTALTTPASGDFLPIVDISEAAAASKNKRITIEELMRGMPDGTAAAPSIAFESDPNTGIYSPGADQLAISTNGTGRLFVDASGNVGLGTSSPQTLCHIIDTNPLVVGDGSGSLAVTHETGTTAVGQGGGIFLGIPASAGSFFSTYIKAARESATSTNSAAALVFGTRVNSGSNTERVRITAAGLVGIGTTTVDAPDGTNADNPLNGQVVSVYGSSPALNLVASSATGYSLVNFGRVGGSTNPYRFVVGYDQVNDLGVLAGRSSIVFKTDAGIDGASERARIDSSGRLLVGTSSARSNFFNTTFASLFQVEGANDNNKRAASIVYGNSGDSGPILALGKTKSNSLGGNTLVASGDQCGWITFQGADGTELVEAASIIAQVDGTPGANDMPGRLVFLTTSDGAASATERLRITSAGVIQVADAGNISVGTTTGTKIGTATTQKLGFYNATPVVQPAAVADATDAATVITQLNDLLAKLRTLGLIAT